MPRTVRLLGVPVDLYLAASRHTDELAREFALISFGEQRDVSSRLLELVDDLRRNYATTTNAIRARVEDAARRRETAVDIDLPANETAVDITVRLNDILDAADEFCRSGDLLTLAETPAVRAWRHWWRDEVVRQTRQGGAPSPWPEREDA
jgi:hypothetical protein